MEHLGLHFSEYVRYFSRAMDGLFSTLPHRNIPKIFYHNNFLFFFLAGCHSKLNYFRMIRDKKDQDATIFPYYVFQMS